MSMLVARIVVALLVVLAVIWLLARSARRPLARRSGGALAVLARHRLGRNASVAVLRVAGRAMVVGITDNQVTLLGDTDLAAFEQQQTEWQQVRSPRRGDAPLAGSVLSRRTWSQTVEFLRDRTARRP